MTTETTARLLHVYGFQRLESHFNGGAETARVVHVQASLGNLLPGAPANRNNFNLIARAGDVQMNCKRQTKRMDEVFVAQVAGVRSATR